MAAAKYLCGAAVLASAVFSANVEESTAENPSEATVLSPQHAEAAAAATPQEEEVEAGRELWGAPAWGGHYYWPPRPYYGKGGKSGGNGSWSGGKGGKSGGDDDDGWSGWSGWSGRPSWGGWPADDDGYYYGKGGKSGSYGGKGAKSGSYSDDDDGWSWGGGWPGWGPPPPRPCYCPPGKSGKTKGGKTKGRGLEAESAGGGDAEGRQLWGSPWYGPHYSGCHCGWPNYGKSLLRDKPLDFGKSPSERLGPRRLPIPSSQFNVLTLETHSSSLCFDSLIRRRIRLGQTAGLGRPMGVCGRMVPPPLPPLIGQVRQVWWLRR